MAATVFGSTETRHFAVLGLLSAWLADKSVWATHLAVDAVVGGGGDGADQVAGVDVLCVLCVCNDCVCARARRVTVGDVDNPELCAAHLYSIAVHCLMLISLP